MERKLFYLLFIFLLFFCKKNEESLNIEHSYPSEFINISTQINVKVDKETDNLLERLTKYENINQYSIDCVDNGGNVCEKNKTETVETKFYFNFDDKDKKLIVIDDYQKNCNCSTSGVLLKKMQSISLNQISSIDTITIDEGSHGQKITSLIISPKYKNETIEHKEIRIYFSNNQGITYGTYSGITNNDIFIKVDSKLAMHLKDLLENLIYKYNENYSPETLDKIDNFSEVAVKNNNIESIQ